MAFKTNIPKKLLALLCAAAVTLPSGGIYAKENDLMTELCSLTVNYMSEPLGIDGPATFGWKMKSNLIGQKQTAYRVNLYEKEELVWTSGKKDGSASFVSCGYELKEQTEYVWEVTVWDKNGDEVSASSVFETGITDNEEWKNARFICLPASSSAPIFRTERPLKGEVSRARLYITAIGVYSAMVNGVPVYKLENGERVYQHMNPGYSDGSRFITYETYDVTQALDGQSAAVVCISAGTGWANADGDGILAQSGGRPGVKAMLSLEYSDGERENIVTCPESWFATLDGPITANGVYYGEDYDARKAMALGEYWLPNYDVSLWRGADASDASSNVIINEFEPVNARYVRLSVSETGPATADDKENRLQIMEMEVFDEGGNNAALGAEVTASDSFTWAEQWQSSNLTDGDGGEASDCGYTTNILGTNGESFFRPQSPITVTLDLGKEASLSSIRLHCRVKRTSVSGNICPNYPAEYSVLLSADGESWIPAVSDYRPQAVKTSSDGLGTLSYGGEIIAAKGMSGRIVDEFEQRPVSVTLYTGVKEQSELAGGEIAVDALYSSFEGGVTLKSGQTMVVDMGQNLTAIPELKVIGEEGTTVAMKFAEMLNDGSSVGGGAHDASGPKGSIYTYSLRTARSEARYTLFGGGEEVYQPTMSFFGYRYVQITADKAVTITGLRSRAVSSVSRQTGRIETNNADVNRLFLNALYSQLSNYFTIPTDCPQRDERLAWTGDAQAFAKTALYNFDSFAFLNAYQDMLSRNTLIDGFPAAVVSLSGYFYHWAMGWSDVEVINAYMLYAQSGDRSVIENNWDALTAYMSYLQRSERALNRSPLPDKWAYGDWLAFQGTGYEVIADLYYGYITSLMAEMAEAIGKGDEAEAYRQKFLAQKEAFLSDHVVYSPNEDEGTLLRVKSGVCSTDKIFDWNKIGTLEDNSQTSLIWMLKLGWYENEDMKNEAVRLLVENIRNENPNPAGVRAESGKNTLSVGFLGSNVITPVLTEAGCPSVSYDLLLNTDMPSWLFEVKAGATTIWERWNSYDPDNGFGDSEMNSFNHFAYGSIAEWMYEYMAGISAKSAGFGEIALQPATDKGEGYNDEERIRSVAGEYESCRGLIKSAWTADENGVLKTYSAAIPANTSATLYLPVENYDGGFTNISGVTVLGTEPRNGRMCLKLALESGGYDFTVSDGAVTAFIADGYITDDEPRGQIKILSVKAENGVLSYELYSSFDDADVYAALYCGGELIEVRKNSLSGEFTLPKGQEDFRLKVMAWKVNTQQPISEAITKIT